MAKSRNRKNHKKKVTARKVRLESQQKNMIKQLEEMKSKSVEEQESKESNTSGEVPFTLSSK